MTASLISANDVAGAFEALKAARPRVHAVVNSVAETFAANVMLALGITPSMTSNPEEVADFATGADALVVNLGTLDAGRREAITRLVDSAGHRPWVLDPTFVDRSPLRCDFAAGLIGRRPTILRANPAELAALGRGEASLPALAARWNTVLTVTEAVDQVASGERLDRVANGHELMSRVTASGCALGAVMAAFAAVDPDPHDAAVAALVTYGVAGEIAGRAAKGPGSFQAAFLDALYALSPDAVASGARILEVQD
ncbi:hydroxyethylthiazole kinase [Lutibaculum baratangense]|uniref:Hydroxyethylthiazole kinase n=1 Tax=Lutibaculum baratangense AMV1 TaxID=631454 RepID=V4QWS8_9HYPH|nr:hydroxyethylthiazole kinase [Lutibaculum baratangense]ESR24227.1 Hydroxyethylthiazole kinase [Lutibaculum baratangense AMV1]